MTLDWGVSILLAVAQSEWISPSEAAALLGITPRTLQTYAEAGKVAVKRLPSQHRRYRRADIERIFDEPAEDV